jgi:hypothetical protein
MVHAIGRGKRRIEQIHGMDLAYWRSEAMTPSKILSLFPSQQNRARRLLVQVESLTERVVQTPRKKLSEHGKSALWAKYKPAVVAVYLPI